jgi:hypothetical protein
MKLLTGFTYYENIASVQTDTLLQQSEGINSFNFPLNVQDYGEEPFLVGGKYGLHFVASGDVSENMIDFRVESGSIGGGIIFTGNGLTLGVIYTKMNDLSCARINQMAWNAAVSAWGANAKTNFAKLTKMYFNGFEGGFQLKPYYRGTEDVIEEIYSLLCDTSTGDNKLIYCTSTNIGVQLGEPMYMKKPIIINAQESEQLFTESSCVIDANSSPDSIQIIPLFKKSIHRIISTPAQLRFQEIFGVNSIYAIMDRLTSKYTQHIQITSTKTISIKFYESNDLMYPIDSKIILTYGDSLPSYTSTFEDYVFDNNIFNSNVAPHLNLDSGAGSGELILNKYDWCIPAIVEYVHVHLFDEDEIILNSTSNYTDIYLIQPTCVFDFPTEEFGNTLNMDNIINLSHRTNGLICNIVYNRFRNTLYNSNRFSYLFTYTDFTNISNDDNNYFVLSCIDNDIPQMNDAMYYAITCKENFGIISDNFIVIDGIPRGCNETHYLSGTMFMKESRDVNSTTFHLYIGVRRLSKNILDKVTHYNDYSFTRYINNFHTMGSNADGYDSNLGKIMMTSEYTIFLNMRSYKTPTLADYGTERKYFDTSVMMNNLKDTSTQLLTLEESQRMEYICYPEDYMHFLYGRETRDNEISGIAYQVASAQNFIFNITPATTNELYDDYRCFLKNSTILTVKFDNKIYEEGTCNIRFMTYPIFNTETSTSVINFKGCFIDEKDKKHVLYIQLTDSEFNTIVNAITYGEPLNMNIPQRIDLNVKRNVFKFYFNGVRPLFTNLAMNEIIITNQQDALPLNVYNNVVNIGEHSTIYERCFLLTEQDINLPLPTVDTASHRKTTDIHPMCQLIFMDDIFIGTIKVSSKMLLNPRNLLYYIDMSVRVQIKPSLLRSYTFNETLYDTFSVTVGMNSITSNITYYPLREDYWNTYLFAEDPQVKCYIDNGILITNFRIYEQVTCPFNFSSLMKVVVKVGFAKTYINHSHMSAFSFKLLDTMWHKNKERNETSFLYIPSYSDHDRITTSNYATYMSGATRNYSDYPFDNANAGLVMKRCSTSTSVENYNYHAKIKASSRVKQCIGNISQNFIVFTTIQTFGATSLRTNLYPMFIGVNSLTGDTVSGAVGIYPSKITGGVKSGTTYLSRTLFLHGYGGYSVLTGTTNYPSQSGNTEYIPILTSQSMPEVVRSIINSNTSTIYLGNRFKFIGGTTSTRYCVLKYASIDNLPMHGLNNIDF